LVGGNILADMADVKRSLQEIKKAKE